MTAVFVALAAAPAPAPADPLIPGWDAGAAVMAGTVTCTNDRYVLDMIGAAYIEDDGARVGVRVWADARCSSGDVVSNALSVSGYGRAALTAPGVSCGLGRNGQLDGSFNVFSVDAVWAYVGFYGRCTIDGVVRDDVSYFMPAVRTRAADGVAGVLQRTGS